MKKVIFILFALALVSCRPSSNQSASESSASDSVELKSRMHGNRHTGLTVLKPYWRRKGMSMMLRHPLPTNLRGNTVSMS